jgi:hypothetical protein
MRLPVDLSLAEAERISEMLRAWAPETLEDDDG